MLDTRDLDITRVEHWPPGATKAAVPLAFVFGQPRQPALGTPLHVTLPAPQAKGAQLSIGVRFATRPTSSAIQFLEPSQTAGVCGY